MFTDLRCAGRVLLKRWPVHAALAAVLGFGLAAALILFSLEDTLRLRPLQGLDADGLVYVGAERRDGRRATLTTPDVDVLRDRVPGLRAITGVMASGCLLADATRQIKTTCAEVSPSFWSVVGLTADTGGEAFHSSAGPRPAIVSHRFWRRQLGGRADVRGMTLSRKEVDLATTELVDRPIHIIGVAPPGFHQPGDTDVWLAFARAGPNIAVLADFELWARLQPSATIAGLTPHVQRALRETSLASDDPADVRGVVRPLAEALVPEGVNAIAILLATAIGILFIGWLAAGTLMAASVASARHEYALRIALGARRRDLLRIHLAQGAILGVAAWTIGVLAAWWLLPVMARHVPLAEGRHVALGALGVLLAAAVSFGGVGLFLLILWRAIVRPLDAHGILTDLGSRRVLTDHRRTLHVSLSVALALTTGFAYVALVLTLVFCRLYWREPGFDVHNLATLTSLLPWDRDRPEHERDAFYAAALERLRQLPSVSDATLVSNSGPLAGWRTPIDVRSATSGASVLAQASRVRPGFFRTLKVPLRAGREFLDPAAERADAVIVNERLARLLWGERDAVGRQLALRDARLTIVGVAADFHERDLATPPGPQVFLPGAGTTFVIRGRTSLAQAFADAGAAIRSVRPDARVFSGVSYDTRYWSLTRLERSRALFMGLLAAVALLIGLLALWGHVSHLVSVERKSVAVLRALGAPPDRVLTYVFGPLCLAIAAGAAAGVLLGIGAARVLGTLLVGASTWDPLAAILAVCAVCAGALFVAARPAAALMSMTPAEVLKQE